MLTIILDGNNFSDLLTFYIEVDRLLTKNLDWETGHNLDAFNDLLRGGFGVFRYEEPVKLVWSNFKLSERNLGKHLTNDIRQIINSHGHIEFVISD